MSTDIDITPSFDDEPTSMWEKNGDDLNTREAIIAMSVATAAVSAACMAPFLMVGAFAWVSERVADRRIRKDVELAEKKKAETTDKETKKK